MTEPMFLADENFRGDIVQATRRLRPEVDLVTVHQFGLSGTPDDEILEVAYATGRIVLSHDVNAMIDEAVRRIRAGKSIAGLLLVAQRSSRKAVAESIVLVSLASEADDWHDVIDFLPW